MNRMLKTAPAWEIFCRVVDNFGDIGVSLRLARELAQRSAAPVRLWVDDWEALGKLCPQLGTSLAGGDLARGVSDGGVEFRHWREDFSPLTPGAVVIEAFGCELPERQLQAMLACEPTPQWINLEYLSAETWVAGCHGLASPHPRLPLQKFFFFPGFDADSGGLLREADLFARRDAFLALERERWLADCGVDRNGDELCISLFAYEQPALGDLLAYWAAARERVHLLVPEGRVLGELATFLGERQLRAGDRRQRGQLRIHVLPFVAQTAFDQLLWACDVNFVRGEDSFVRAQWAAVPLVWQLYPQHEKTHFDKLAAFLERYLAGLPVPLAAAVERMWQAWNGAGELVAAWPDFARALPQLQPHARAWAARQAAFPDLASQLIRRCCHSEERAG